MTELLERLRENLGDRYDVEREIGEGGMATVFLARDIRIERRVAIKVLHEDLGAALGAERFRREIQIATSLTHPHILTLYDSGQAAGSLYYVMPFIEGESLRHRIDREKQLPIDQALKITGEVAGALDYAHRKGVIHRDIKPENILLEDGHAIVADFGIARAVSTMGEGGGLTKTGMSLGTPTYMSPEQAFAEKDIDGRSDLYSLACVLYEMLVGQPPFSGANAQAIMARHSMSEVPSMQIVRATIPDEVEAAVQKALSKSPADRFATVAEFCQELEECVIDYHTTTRRTVGDRRTVPRIPPGRRATELTAAVRPWWRRTPAIAGAALLVIALAGSGWWVIGKSATAAAGDLPADKLAVMYFQDVSTDGQLAYLADGLTESLINRLGEVDALTVVSQGGVAPYRGKEVSVDSIARALAVGTIVRGTVEPIGDRIQINVRIVDGNTGEITAREEIDQPRTNIIAAQDSVAEIVADLLRSRVGAAVSLQSARAGTANSQAWTLFQRAQVLRKDAATQLGQTNVAAAARSFSAADSLLLAASALDPRWNEPITARSAVALARARGAESGTAAKPWIQQGIAAAQSVLDKNPRDAGALEMRGTLRYVSWQYSLASNPRERTALLDGAQQDLQRAVTIDRKRATAWNQLSTVYSQMDNTVQAKVAATRAYESDAYLSGTDRVLWKLYATSYDLQQFRDAETFCADGGRRFPENKLFVRCRLWLQTVKSVTPDVDGAWRDYARLQAITPPQQWKLEQSEARMLVAAAIGRAGLIDSARKVILSARPDPADDKEGELAGVEAFIRTLFGTQQDTVEAFSILNRYVSGSPQHLQGLAESQSWWWTRLKDDPRFPR